MYGAIEKYFSRRSAGRLVAEALLRYGLSVDGKGAIYCGTIEMAPAKIARGIGVDCRVVIAVAGQIARHEELLCIFAKLRPRAYIGESAKMLGFDSIEISADAHATGIIESVAKIFSDNRITIRQIVADDPDLFPEPKLNIVVDGKLPTSAIAKIRKLGAAEKILIR